MLVITHRNSIRHMKWANRIGTENEWVILCKSHLHHFDAYYGVGLERGFPIFFYATMGKNGKMLQGQKISIFHPERGYNCESSKDEKNKKDCSYN